MIEIWRVVLAIVLMTGGLAGFFIVAGLVANKLMGPLPGSRDDKRRG